MIKKNLEMEKNHACLKTRTNLKKNSQHIFSCPLGVFSQSW